MSWGLGFAAGGFACGVLAYDLDGREHLLGLGVTRQGLPGDGVQLGPGPRLTLLDVGCQLVAPGEQFPRHRGSRVGCGQQRGHVAEQVLDGLRLRLGPDLVDNPAEQVPDVLGQPPGDHLAMRQGVLLVQPTNHPVQYRGKVDATPEGLGQPGHPVDQLATRHQLAITTRLCREGDLASVTSEQLNVVHGKLLKSSCCSARASRWCGGTSPGPVGSQPNWPHPPARRP